jgi:hypothetical protein
MPRPTSSHSRPPPPPLPAAHSYAPQAALLKRVETRRAEHVKLRELDVKRLLQRNRNVVAVLEQRQAQEEQRRTAEIRSSLAPPRVNAGRLQPLNTGQPRAAAAATAAAGASASAAGAHGASAAARSHAAASPSATGGGYGSSGGLDLGPAGMAPLPSSHSAVSPRPGLLAGMQAANGGGGGARGGAGGVPGRSPGIARQLVASGGGGGGGLGGGSGSGTGLGSGGVRPR